MAKAVKSTKLIKLVKPTRRLPALPKLLLTCVLNRKQRTDKWYIHAHTGGPSPSIRRFYIESLFSVLTSKMSAAYLFIFTTPFKNAVKLTATFDGAYYFTAAGSGHDFQLHGCLNFNYGHANGDCPWPHIYLLVHPYKELTYPHYRKTKSKSTSTKPIEPDPIVIQYAQDVDHEWAFESMSEREREDMALPPAPLTEAEF